jgi:formiminotetrahydrofolate cyclodeaminase
MAQTDGAQHDSRSLVDLTVGELVDRLSSRAPVPGGGSAAALAGAMGAGLVAMVAALTVGRAEYADVEPAARDLGAAAARVRDELLDLAERDSQAYDAVVRARRLPRDDEAQRAERSAAMAAAFALAAEIPMRTAEVSAQALELASRIAPIGNRNAVSDAGVAAQLASAGVRGAILNVRINLPYLPADASLRTSGEARLERLEAQAREREAAALAAVADRLG